jgi:hypothetical protein
MRLKLFFITLLIINLAPIGVSAQEFGMLPTTEQQQVQSLTIARNMLKAVMGINNHFADFKGEFLQKDANESLYYKVKGLDLGASEQYVIVNSKGITMYVAIFKAKDVNDKSAILAFNAFAGGIMTVRQYADIGVKIEDAETKGGIIKYYLRTQGTKIAAFTFAPADNTGTLLVAVQ